MSEKVIIRQTKDYTTTVLAFDPEEPGADKPVLVGKVPELSPYGMVLAGLGTCTAFVVNTYAEHHGLAVDAVEIELGYGRSFKDDCEHCEEIDKYEDQIEMAVRFEGSLTSQEREKLFKISLQCPVHKMLKSGIKVKSQPAPHSS
jgi:putative redox protein